MTKSSVNYLNNSYEVSFYVQKLFCFYHTHILLENSIHLHTKCHSAGSLIWCRDKTCILPKTENKEYMIQL